MGKKYIIELVDRYNSEFKGIIVLGLTQEKQISVELIPKKSMTPYTEPEPHAEVTADAYQRGHENGFIAGHLKAKKLGQSFYEDGYQRGLNDAWECARKIRGMTWDEQREVFGTDYYTDIIALPVSECIEKIRQYEQEKGEQIQVGDEVENTQTGVRFIVTHTWFNNHGEKGVSGFNHDCSSFSTTIELVKKTGRHFPEITEVLRKMKETDNG